MAHTSLPAHAALHVPAHAAPRIAAPNAAHFRSTGSFVRSTNGRPGTLSPTPSSSPDGSYTPAPSSTAGRSSLAGLVQVAAAAILWGLGAGVAAAVFAASAISPVALTFWRFALAAILLAAIHALRRRTRGGPSLWSVAVTNWHSLLIIGVTLAAAQSLMYAAVDSMGAALGTIIVLAASPVMMALFSIPLLRLVLNPAGWLTMLLPIAAVVALVAGTRGLDSGQVTWLGPVIAVAAASCHSIMTIGAKKVPATSSDLLSTTTLTFAVAALALAIPSSVTGFWAPTQAPVTVIGGIIILAVAASAAAYLAYFAGVRTVAPATAAVVMLLQLVAATVVGVVVLDEPMTAMGVVALIALLAGIVVHIRCSHSRPLTARAVTRRLR